MLINAAILAAAQTAFNTLFNGAYRAVKQQYKTVAMDVPSNTTANDYKWLELLPGLREWLGDKVVNNLQVNGMFLRNRDFEVTVGVDRNDIEDDQLGIYNPLFANLGNNAAQHPDILVFEALALGFTTGLSFDGQPMFSLSHPVDGNDAAAGVYANRPVALGAGDAWFLMDDSRPIKPMIFQKRKDYTFVSATDPQSPDVFNQRQFKYGVEARVTPGYGLPQLIYGSRQPLDAAGYEAARLAMTSQKRPDGSPLGIRPMTLVVTESNFKAANILVKNDRDAAGATNPWIGSAEVVKVDMLNGL